MDETIDLRPYVEALVRHFRVIGGAVILAIVLGVAFFLLSNKYEAAALVTVPEPSQQLQFDPRITTTIRSTQLLPIYPQLALSDDVLARLVEKAGEITNGEIVSPSQLYDVLEVRATDARMVRLYAKDSDPKIAAALANAWADEFILAVERVYGTGGTNFFTDQLAKASAELQAAEDALVAFQRANRQGIVDNELAALIQLQMSYLAEQNAFRLALDDIQTLRVQLENNGTDVVTLADQLTALTLQLQAYDAPVVSATPMPQQRFQLTIGADAQPTTAQRAEQLQRLEALRVSIEAGLAAREAQLVALEPQIFAVQTEKQQLFNEGERLIRRRDIAQETYATLVRKVDEERVATRETLARLASQAAVPERPARPNPFMLLPLLAVAAVLVSVAAIILMTWWRNAQPIAVVQPEG